MTDPNPKTSKNTSRRGRPPAEEAGLAEGRLLDAATTLFLELGFGRTTVDKVSTISGVGKSSIYARFASKEELFAAVVTRSIASMFDDMKPVPPDLDVKDRLRHVGKELAQSLLVPRCVSLMRITAAEAVNFPELASMAYQVSFDGSIRRILQALGGSGNSLEKRKATRIAVRFLEVAIQPISFQAAFGADIAVLRKRWKSDVDDAIRLLEARGDLSGF